MEDLQLLFAKLKQECSCGSTDCLWILQEQEQCNRKDKGLIRGNALFLLLLVGPAGIPPIALQPSTPFVLYTLF
jgi:hypothetical protein